MSDPTTGGRPQFDNCPERLAPEEPAQRIDRQSVEETSHAPRSSYRPTPGQRGRRKTAPTLSNQLIEELRQICQEMGYVNDRGGAILASPVIEAFLWLAVEAYRQGHIEQYEEQVTTTKQAWRWKA